MNISARTIYIGLLSPTVAVHRPYWCYSKTLSLLFGVARIWSLHNRLGVEGSGHKWLMNIPTHVLMMEAK